VSGIDGVFVYASDPHALAAWYAEHFELAFLASEEERARGMCYLRFHYRKDADPSVRWSTTFAILPAVSTLGSERGEYMVNYRVDDMVALVGKLTRAGVAVEPAQEQLDGRSPGSTGLFAHLRDGEGNRIELYQPL
jgi:predicted enzyme related to lactoylglutathione lyase